MQARESVPLDLAKRLLEKLDSVHALVVSEDGLPIEFSGIERSEAEEVSAIASQLALFAERRLEGSRRVAITLLSPARDMVIYALGSKALIAYTKPGYAPAIARSLQLRGPRCEKCGADLSLAIVECASCGALNPWGAERCSRCGQPLLVRRCPSCGARIDASGHVIGLRERLAPRVHKVVVLSD